MSFLSCLLLLASTPARADDASFRPPAIPLVTHDPYFSVWSMSDRLTDEWTKHWTGTINAMCGLARIDGKAYRFMAPAQIAVPPMKQVSVKVWPTCTIYDFEEAGVHLTLTFTTPALLDDLDILARPVTYISWDARSLDDKKHAVSLYFDATGEWVVNKSEQPVVWGRYHVGDMKVMRIGSKDQAVLAKSGDNLRIDWGYLTLAIPTQGPITTVMEALRDHGCASVAGPVAVGGEDQRRRADEPRVLAQLGRHHPDVAGEFQPGVRAQRLLERVEQQRARLGKPAADRDHIEVAQQRGRRDRDAERPARPAQRGHGHRMAERGVAGQFLGRGVGVAGPPALALRPADQRRAAGDRLQAAVPAADTRRPVRRGRPRRGRCARRSRTPR